MSERRETYTCLRCREITCVSLDTMREHVETAHAYALERVKWHRGETTRSERGELTEWYGHVAQDVPFLCLVFVAAAERVDATLAQ